MSATIRFGWEAVKVDAPILLLSHLEKQVWDYVKEDGHEKNLL